MEIGILSRLSANAETLLSHGFEVAARWTLKGSNLVVAGNLPNTHGIYAFSLDETIVYVGMTSVSFQRRLYGYAHPGPTQRTNIRLNGLLKKCLSKNQSIDILVLPDQKSRWHGIEVDMTPGIEAALLEHLEPKWNIQGR